MSDFCGKRSELNVYDDAMSGHTYRYIRLKHTVERERILLQKLKDNVDNLSAWGYRDMGYYQGRLSVLEDLLDEMESSNYENNS